MKFRTRLFIGATLSIMLMGGAYATWTDGFNVTTKVETYEFDCEIETVKASEKNKVVKINDDLKAFVTFELSDPSPEIIVRNTGTIPIYVEEINVMYNRKFNLKNVNNYAYIRQLVYKEQGNDGSTDNRIDIDIDDLFEKSGYSLENLKISIGENIFTILPKALDENEDDRSERTIKLSRDLKLDDLTQKFENERSQLELDVQNLNASIANAKKDEDTSSDENLRDEKQECINDISSVINDISQAFYQDELTLEFELRM